MGDASERPDPLPRGPKGAFEVTRRPDTLVSPYGHPEPEQRRDLIGARLLGDSSQYRPALLLIGWKLMAKAKGAF